ncbi:MAG: hypothetical protein KBD65_02725 [Candidatus Moranbacteria bacterium]|nr:hypothetical protein [Candidatus Moranbacteria bacterium]
MEKGIRVHFKMQNGGERDAIGATVMSHEGGILILESDEAEELRFYETAPGDWRMLHEQVAGHWQAHETGPIYDII